MSVLVSTIIPVFNRAVMLKEAVDSVVAQSHRPIEIIIVDDGSTDDTLQSAQQLAASHTNHNTHIKVVSQTNQGPGAARETGRMHVAGEFIQYLDSDDLLLPNKFQAQIAALLANPNAEICYGKETRRDKNYTFNGYQEFVNEAAIKFTEKEMTRVFPYILYGSLWGTSVPLWRKSLCDQMGAWFPLNNEEDIEYDARAGIYGADLIRIDEFVSVQRVHGAHLSSQGVSDPKMLAHRVIAREYIYSHALASGMRAGDPALQFFAKSTFLLARQCGETGLKKECRAAINVAKMAMGGRYPIASAYILLQVFLGAKIASKLNKIAEKARRG